MPSPVAHVPGVTTFVSRENRTSSIETKIGFSAASPFASDRQRKPSAIRCFETLHMKVCPAVSHRTVWKHAAGAVTGGSSATRLLVRCWSCDIALAIEIRPTPRPMRTPTPQGWGSDHTWVLSEPSACPAALSSPPMPTDTDGGEVTRSSKRVSASPGRQAPVIMSHIRARARQIAPTASV